VHASSLTTGAQSLHPHEAPPSTAAARGGDTLAVTLPASAAGAGRSAAAASTSGAGGGGGGTVSDVTGGASAFPLAHAAASATPIEIPATAPKSPVVRIAPYTACRDTACGAPCSPLGLDIARARAHHSGMATDPKPSALQDLTKGLGLLFRAAKTTLQKLPTGELEEAVITSAKEVGRAIENVTQTVSHTVEKQIFRRPSEAQRPEEAGPEGATKPPAPSPGQPEKPVAVRVDPGPKDPNGS
jgi:hypothetical protein